ncbi:uncharacterized protein RCC_04688 [Ramularia collo-cygni]|uniref:SANT domain-containing protein n=1 Tax=Ramularia collo-cygni TaxID=112498 RepID=A0A2D3VE13_9PEZI|nr:uncharacterized protein RCC_04688 [Ramularia collo-cygni]CZT18843.1 uncharacterized protein RCC_04688 [Ramularia collo-cygni]
MNSYTASRRPSRIKISRDPELPPSSSSGPAGTEPIDNDKKANGYLIASYPETKAAAEFRKREFRHRDDDGKLLDPKRHIDRRSLTDTNHLIDPARATQAFNFSPANPRFTPIEHLKFALAFQDTPAKFGKIAALLPGRKASECINHYYRHKSDGRFKIESRKARYDRLRAPIIDGVVVPPPEKELAMSSLPEWDIRLREFKGQNLATSAMDGEEYYPNGRSKRKAPAAPNYGPSEQDLLELVPIDMHVEALRKALGIPSRVKVFEKMRPGPRRKQVVVPRPFGLDVLCKSFQHPSHMTEHKLMDWLRSETVLPLLKECFTAVVHNKDLYAKLQLLLGESEYPWSGLIGDLAQLAHEYKLFTPPDMKIMHQEIVIKLAQFVYRIGHANDEFLKELHRPNAYPEPNMYFDGASVLLLAIRDFTENKVDGFFATLLSSELAWMVKPTVREHWERLYTFEGEETTADDPMDIEDAMDVESSIAVDDPVEETVESEKRKKWNWDKIIKYEGTEGKEQDWDTEEVIVPAKPHRMDSARSGPSK